MTTAGATRDKPTTSSGRGPVRGPSVAELLASYRDGSRSPSAHVATVLETVERRGDDGTWISVDAAAARRRAAELEATPGASDLPLYGVPFAVKDSIDVAGFATTLACPAYAYEPGGTAPAVQRLLDAGAICLGKTNLDQFATGLNGTRTPYTVPRSVFGDDLISGGSSSGSALAVALGEVPFAVATDTAGSGRVPPALNGVLGFKPSRGLLSTVGLVPACRSLDCLSLVAADVDDLRLVLGLMAGVDERDPWSRPRRRRADDPARLRVGLPDEAELSFFGDTAMADAHHAARTAVARAFSTLTPPLAPFLAAGELLYAGPWVAERLVEFGDFLDEHRADVLPVVEQIISGGARFSATDVFRAQYRLAELKAEVARLFETMDVLVLPSVGTTFTVPEVLADPVATNTVLGHYTHFGNLLDLCAVAVPAGTTEDGRPVSLMVLAPALDDDLVLGVAARLLDPLPA
ncbi:allophanate hydrolase [Microlunatus flavus]|uniref:Allophanate hydrolase n=1 Tax=Microlunatus flavus TaxID=1036181 RepID=A0A1H9FEJ0_9ACTN|nr:allophanate hydrolase [Microlunatus flavus]SEQ36299.1 allophanate hydrolase [Microlunatus flavus]